MSDTAPEYSPASWSAALARGDARVVEHYADAPAHLVEHARRRARCPVAPLTVGERAEWKAWLGPRAPRAVLKNLERLGDSRATVVITGQQTGLLGGPLFVLWKAIAAVQWARRVEAELGTPVVPVFWIASDDHDFAEVRTTRWLDREGRVASYAVDEDPAQSGWPVAARAIAPEHFSRLADALVATTEDSAARDALLAFISDLGTRPATWESQFLDATLRWMGSLGIVPVAPRLAWLRARAADIVRRDLAAGTGGARIVAEGASRLRQAGIAAGTIHRQGDEAGFFLLEGGVRAKLRWRGDALDSVHPIDGRVLHSYTRAQIEERLVASPADFSPNAAVRPLVQDHVLPTIAYVGGPAECVYHAQIAGLYERYEVFRPIVIPRPSVTLVDAVSTRALRTLGIEAPSAAARPDAIDAAVLGSKEQASARTQFAASALAFQSALDALAGAAESTSPGAPVVSSVAKLRRRAEYSLERLRERHARGLLERETTTARAGTLLRDRLWPEGQPQERHIGWLAPLLTAYSADNVAERLARHVGIDAPEMQALALEASFDAMRPATV